MGRQAFPIIGGIIGAVVAGIASDGSATAQGYEAGFAVGAAIGGVAGSYIDPILIQGNTVGDNALQAAAEGGARAIMFGKCCVTATCVLARGNRQVVTKKTSNGKGSSGSTANQTVTWTFAIGLGEAITGKVINRIWQDELLVYDVSGDSLISQDDNSKFAAKFRFYDGNESQLPDPDLQVFLDDDTPYFRGTAYVVFPNFDLTQTAERIPTFKFEITDFVGYMQWATTGVTDIPLIEQSVVLPGADDTMIDIDVYVTMFAESRKYAHLAENLHTYDPTEQIIRVLNTDAVPSTDTNNNIVALKVVPVNPLQDILYYVFNNAQVTGGIPQYVIQWSNTLVGITVPANATLIWYMDPVDGKSMLTVPQQQFGQIRIDGDSATVSGTAGTVPYALNLNGSQQLSGIVTTLMDYSGITSDLYDVTALTDMVDGVCVQSTVTGQDAVTSIVSPYFADPTEVDGKIKFVKRGGAVLRTLTIDDLTEEPDVANRDNAIEYPAKLSFYYQSPLTGYAATKATSYRYSAQVDSSGEGSVTAPVTFDDVDTPARIAQKLHMVMWTEAEGNFQWTVGDHCIDLVPTDVIGISLRGITNRVRITAIENDGPTIQLTLIKDRQSSYTSSLTGMPVPAPTPPQPTTMSPSVLAVLDIPALVDSDDQLCYYTAVSGSTSVWSGAELQRSLDSGATWNPIGEVSTPGCVMGKLTAAMTATDREYTDTTNTVMVQLFDTSDELESQSDTTFLQEQGAVAVQLADGTWEVMQYRDATEVSAGAWKLSYLQRGRLNTVAGVHAIGALFVLLDGNIVKNAAQVAWLNADLEHRAVSYSTATSGATPVDITYTGRSQREWAPASATAQYDGSFVYVSAIIPRYRFGTEVVPIPSVNFAGYRVTITDGTHTMTADIPTGNAAHIAVVAPVGTVTGVSVAALNTLTGAGDSLTLPVQTVAAGSLAPQAIVNAGGGS